MKQLVITSPNIGFGEPFTGYPGVPCPPFIKSTGKNEGSFLSLQLVGALKTRAYADEPILLDGDVPSETGVYPITYMPGNVECEMDFLVVKYQGALMYHGAIYLKGDLSDQFSCKLTHKIMAEKYADNE